VTPSSGPRTLAALLALLAPTALAAQGPAPTPGTVLSEQKISNTAGGVFLPIGQQDQFGRSVTCLGDLDGDGIQDLAVGAHGDDDGGTLGNDSNVGAVWILFMRPDGTPKSVAKISKTRGDFHGDISDGDEMGRAIGAIGDLDGDGVPDLAVGSAKDGDGGARRGALFILFLNRDGTVKSHQKISATEGGFDAPLDNFDQFGRAMAPLGDFDGDGVTELAVGAPFDDDGGTQRGAIYVLFMRSDGTVKSWQKISDTAGGFEGVLVNWDIFGFSLACLGDLDLDGTVDLVTGAPKDQDAGWRHGAVWVLFLKPDGTVKAHQKISDAAGNFTGPFTTEDEFGTGVACLGDVNGDSIPDIGVGAILYDEVGMDHGACWVLFLKRDGTVKGYQKLNELHGGFTGPLDEHDWFGSAVAGPGDLNGDGVADLVVGCRFDDDGGGNKGAIYVLMLQGSAVTPPVAGFVPSVTTGTEPLTVSFADASSAGATSWSWSFGDGGTATVESPSHVYAHPGTYTVSLTVAGPGGSDTLTRNALVHVTLAPPSASFTAGPVAGVAPLAVDFTNLTTGTITGWLWSFGDGATSTEMDPVHVYAQGGTYDVSLTATGPGGSDTFTRPHYVTVQHAAPAPAFGASPAAGAAPLTVTFANESTGGPATSWAWAFGDGTASSLEAPVHTYAEPGTYDVTLTATGPGGTASLARPGLVQVAQPVPVASFSASPSTGVVPLAVAFTNTSTGPVDSWLWSFGDGTSSTEAAPTHVYGSTGTFAVSLTATGPGGVDVHSVPAAVVVTPPPPVAGFQGTPTAGVAPLTVAFTDQSSGVADAWSWEFGDGASSTARHPTHAYAQPGSYDVRLTAAGPGGEDTLLRTSYVVVDPAPPVAAFDVGTAEGFAPLAVAFTDRSGGTVATWSWDFGDGATSTERHPSHVYAAPGDYDVTLTVTGPAGTDSRLVLDAVRAEDPVPVADFAGAPTAGQEPLSVAFVDLSSGDVQSWSWDFGDGSSSTEASPVHVYDDPGSYTVHLTVSGPAGTAARIRGGYVTVETAPPTAAFDAAPRSGFAPTNVQFTDRSIGSVTAWSWDFGDGGISNQRHPSHTYAAPGDYTVRLTTTGPLGTDTAVEVGYVSIDDPMPVADFWAAPSTGVAPLAVSFQDLSSGDVTSRAWGFGDGGTSGETNPVHVYQAPGTYTVTLTASGPAGSDVATQVDLVVVVPPAPVAAFGAAPVAGPAPLAVRFTDRSSGWILNRAWDFGDGGTSFDASPTHVYTTPGLYTVGLSVAGPGGSDDEVRAALVLVEDPGDTGLLDPGFEAQVAGAPPAAPWVRFGTGAHVVDPTSVPSDADFPTDGVQWAEVAATGTSGAIPPSNPGGVTLPASGGTGIRQAFSHPEGRSLLQFEAAFLRNGPPDQASANDWMSVDVDDGVTTVNLYYADTFTPAATPSQKWGWAMTAVEQVSADLAVLFPGATHETSFTLSVQVGNGGGGADPSRGYVDAFRFSRGASALVYGCGVNPPGSLVHLSGVPHLGATVVVGLDNPLGTQGIGSFTGLVFALGPDPHFPCGTVLPGFGMAGPGELLISLRAVDRVGYTLYGPPWSGPGTPSPIAVHLPLDPGLIGETLYAQGLILDPHSRGGVSLAVTDAIELRVGP